eukprot:3110579-Pyramimonas_sp.AAC.1
MRVLSACRKSEAKRWEREHERDWVYATQGKSCERAVWVQSAMNEWASHHSQSSASGLVDLQKAYEHVGH